jgi:hypothetical protein
MKKTALYKIIDAMLFGKGVSIPFVYGQVNDAGISELQLRDLYAYGGRDFILDTFVYDF